MENLKYSEILRENALLAKEVEGIPPYRINILSNITCNQLKDILLFNLRRSGLNPIINIGNYDNIIQDSFTGNDVQLVIVHYDLVNVIEKYTHFVEDFTEEQISSLFETIKSELDLIIGNLKAVQTLVVNTFSAAGIYVNGLKPSNTESLAKRLNEYLYAIKTTNLQVFDINTILTRVGLPGSCDFRMFYLSKTFYTISFWKEYVYALSPVVFRVTGKLKKSVIFDCDNTLWKGILGEDGLEGIDMSPQSKVGQIYNKVQQIAVWLSNKGVIIGLCSKNNPDDIEKVLTEHLDMRLLKENIVISKVNWKDKATNLREIAKELNIGLDSLVFVDDSSFEVNLINEQLPEVLTLQVPIAIHEYPNQLLKLIDRNFFLTDNDVDIEKTKQYKAQSKRNEEMTNYQSMIDYLSSLEIEILIKENDVSQIDRIAQLTQKTNQFNLTTIRYTEHQIEEFMNSVAENILSISVKDKFGESGLTAVIIFQEKNDVVFIVNFLMSCRIMGRNIEQAIMNYIVASYNQKGFKSIEALYIPTSKNLPVSNFYEQSGFSFIKEKDGKKYYSLNIFYYKPHDANYIKQSLLTD